MPRVLAAVLPLFLASCVPAVANAGPPKSGENTASPATPKSERVLGDGAAIKALEADITTKLSTKFPGLAAGLVVDQELAWSKGWGFRDENHAGAIDADTIFRLCSITKVVTGLAVMALADEGKIDLDAPLESVVPEAGQLIYPTTDSPKVTIRHLLTHRSGIPRDGLAADKNQAWRSADDAGVLQDVPGIILEFAPGTDELYSNFGSALLGIVVTKRSGQSFHDYVKSHVLDPLRMTHASFAPDLGPLAAFIAQGHVKEADRWTPETIGRHGGGDPNGGLYASVSDLAKLASFEIAAWPPRNGPELFPIRRATVRASQTVMAPMAHRSGIGAFWEIEDDRVLGPLLFHNGALAPEGYRGTFWVAPLAGLAIIGLASGLDPLHDNFIDGDALDALRTFSQGDASARSGAKEAADLITTLVASDGDKAIASAYSSDGLAKKSVDKRKPFFDSFRAAAGACEAPKPQHREGPTLVFSLKCEKHTYDVRAAYAAGKSVAFDSLTFNAR